MTDPQPLDDRPLTTPARARLPLDSPGREEILTAHETAMTDGRSMYTDPRTGLSVLTARYLADRGYCCGRGCRHCPYVREADQRATTQTCDPPAEGLADRRNDQDRTSEWPGRPAP